jgi:hypothetical protein
MYLGSANIIFMYILESVCFARYLSGSCTLGTAGHGLRPNNLDTTGPSSGMMTEEPYTSY